MRLLGDWKANVLDFRGATLVGGNIVIDGGDGNDTILGTSGGDIFSGGKGSDFLTGGGGGDVFRCCDPRVFLQMELESGPNEGPDDEAIEVH